MSRWDGMKDGDEQTVETPFGEAVFVYVEADRSVGLNGGVLVTSLQSGPFRFDRDELEKCRRNPGCASLADALDMWAGNQ